MPFRDERLALKAKLRSLHELRAEVDAAIAETMAALARPRPLVERIGWLVRWSIVAAVVVPVLLLATAYAAYPCLCGDDEWSACNLAREDARTMQAAGDFYVAEHPGSCPAPGDLIGDGYL